MQLVFSTKSAIQAVINLAGLADLQAQIKIGTLWVREFSRAMLYNIYNIYNGGR